jgi:GT2 family glycosyltransferase
MQQCEWPTITVVTPSFNQGRYLETTIQSVLSQDYPRLQYIIVDGNSTDESTEIIQRYSDRLDWWVSEPDNGQSHALSKGFARASGEILGWLNSDDVYMPDALRLVGEAFRQARDAAVVYGSAQRIDQSGRAVGQPTVAADLTLGHFIGAPDAGVPTIIQPASFMRSDVYRKLGGIDEKLELLMDADLWARAIIGHRFLRLEHVLARFRTHDRSKTVECSVADLHREARLIVEKCLSTGMLSDTERGVALRCMARHQVLAEIVAAAEERPFDSEAVCGALERYPGVALQLEADIAYHLRRLEVGGRQVDAERTFRKLPPTPEMRRLAARVEARRSFHRAKVNAANGEVGGVLRGLWEGVRSYVQGL